MREDYRKEEFQESLLLYSAWGAGNDSPLLPTFILLY
jgi:hypothetical protein